MRVLVVDDDEDVRLLLRAAIPAEPGLQWVGEAEDGLQALRLADELSPDVVVMDLSMPVMDGVEATRRLYSQSPEVLVIIFTAADPTLISAALDAGASGYVNKDDVDSLLELIQRERNGAMDLRDEETGNK